MPNYLIHSKITFELLKLVSADSPEEAEKKLLTFDYDEYQKSSSDEEIISISEVPKDYNLHEDALSKGYN